MPAGGLLAILAGKAPKGAKSDDEGMEEDDEAPDSESGGNVSTLLGDAFDAIKDGDRKGFIRSMKAAIEKE